MGEGGIATANSCPALVIPPRNSNTNHAFLRGGCDDTTPSPMTYSSSIFSEHEPYYTDVKPFSHMESPTFPWLGSEQGFNHNVNDNKDTTTSSDINPDEKSNKNVLEDRKESAGNLSLSSNNTARYKSMMPSRLPIPSMYFTLPPGLSPTMLLESPVLFTAGLADPSPTTGSFLASLNTLEKRIETDDGDKTNENSAQQANDFVFRPHPVVARTGLSHISGTGSFGISNEGAFEFENKPTDQPTNDASMLNSDSPDPYMNTQGCHETLSNMRPQTSEPHKKSTETEKILAHHGLCMNGRPSSDGYNWKKYGQKQLKGTERPRSYYKCTHPHCLVKKHVECSHEGEITEITYKGEHNHPKPQTTRRSSRNPAHMMIQERGGIQLQAHEEKVDSDKNSADFSSSSAVISHTGLTGTPEQSFCSPSDDEEGETKSDCEEEQESKRRRRMENGGEMPHSYPVPITTVREPRVVVQTISEVDILDDGYRWRKYGQKVVKGHNFPRSYYKCTNLGCGVRKHVERSSADPRSVRTTYEGKHNHNVPLARGSA